MGRASQRKQAKRQAWCSTRRVAARTCPVCAKVLDGATAITLDAPGEPWTEIPEGSLSACAYCGAILTAEGATFRRATDAEIAELDPVQRRLFAEAPRLTPRAPKTRVS